MFITGRSEPTSCVYGGDGSGGDSGGDGVTGTNSDAHYT